MEREVYYALVNDGGRPCYEISLLEDVARRPVEYREMLSVWQSAEDDWSVFGAQLTSWREFRTYQLSVRGEGKFPRYIKLLKKRLARHDFTQTYQLDDVLLDNNPDRQDKLATWIEYLNFGYQVYEHYANLTRRHQSHYENAWKELVDSKVLKPFEAQELLDDIASGFQYMKERTDAEEALESAKSVVHAALQALPDPRRSNLPRRDQEPLTRLAAAQSELATAKESFDPIQKRNHLVSEFWGQTVDYRRAKDDAKRHTTILQWMLGQIPLIELELGLNLSKVVENNPDSGDGRGKGLKRGRNEGKGPERTLHHDHVADEPPSKRLRHNESSHHRTSSSDADSGRRDAKFSEPDNSRSKALRHSARIKAREKHSGRAIVASSGAVKNACQGTAELAQVLPFPPTETQGRKARPPATKKSGPNRSVRHNASKPEGITKKGRSRSRPLKETEQRSRRAPKFSK